MSADLLAVKYIAYCSKCNKRFDAASSPWCGCVTQERTIACPHCRRCFCDAPQSYKELFWRDAPDDLCRRRRDEHDRGRAEKPALAPATLKRPLVLFVDDSSVVRLLAAQSITNLGYGYVEADNGEAGLRLARQLKPDLVMTDALMPKLDGREMCRLIKTDTSTSNSTVIIMTGLYKKLQYKLEAYKLFRADDYISKPLHALQLKELLRKHLGAPALKHAAVAV